MFRKGVRIKMWLCVFEDEIVTTEEEVFFPAHFLCKLRFSLLFWFQSKLGLKCLDPNGGAQATRCESAWSRSSSYRLNVFHYIAEMVRVSTVGSQSWLILVCHLRPCFKCGMSKSYWKPQRKPQIFLITV